VPQLPAVRTLRTIRVTRYVTPLREGSSLPAIVEADDDGLYVLKFRGAGQGARALIAELVAGEIARALGLPVPEIVFVDLHTDLARTEPDPEIHALIRDSAGLNLAMDYLPGSVAFDPVVETLTADLASRIVWFDAYVSNVDRSVRNTNLLMWHRRLWLIDHGATLYFHHTAGWESGRDRSAEVFPLISEHVLRPIATLVRDVDEAMAAILTPAVVGGIVALIPDAWLDDRAGRAAGGRGRLNAEGPAAGAGSADTKAAVSGLDVRHVRDAYARYLTARLAAPRAWVEEAARVR
jgi:hypothetical protein